jgi:hypothetical protein
MRHFPFDGMTAKFGNRRNLHGLSNRAEPANAPGTVAAAMQRTQQDQQQPREEF